MCEGEDESEDVGVGGGRVGQGVTVALGVVVGHEDVSFVAWYPAAVVEIL